MEAAGEGEEEDEARACLPFQRERKLRIRRVSVGEREGRASNRISRYSRAVYDVEEEEEEEEGDGEDGNKRVCVTNVTYAKGEGWKTGG